jgi:hypothetical protein
MSMKRTPDDRARVAEFRSVIDAYLLVDLEKMLAAHEPSSLGLPILQTILGSMELVGKLMGGGFSTFYRELVKDEPRYRPAKTFFASAIRHGSAHVCLIHPGVWVTKNGQGHLSRTAQGDVRIDLMDMRRDFVRTYTRLMNEVEAGHRDTYGLRVVLASLHEQEHIIQELAAQLPACADSPRATTQLGSNGE